MPSAIVCTLLSGRTCDTVLDGFRTASEVMVKEEAPDELMPVALMTAVSELLTVRLPEAPDCDGHG